MKYQIYTLRFPRPLSQDDEGRLISYFYPQSFRIMKFWGGDEDLHGRMHGESREGIPNNKAQE